MTFPVTASRVVRASPMTLLRRNATIRSFYVAERPLSYLRLTKYLNVRHLLVHVSSLTSLPHTSR